MRVKLGLMVNKDVVEKACALGLNISKVSNKALKDMIQRIEGSNNLKQVIFEGDDMSRRLLWWGRWDLNPRPPAPEAGSIPC